MSNRLMFSIKDKLNVGDTETTTFGCRANNPDICKNCYVEGVCAFITDDHICRAPSMKWKRYYSQLKENTNE